MGSCVKSRLIWIRCGKPFGGPPFLFPSKLTAAVFLAGNGSALILPFSFFSPDVLLLDEPTASLDEDTARTLFHSLKEESHQTGRTLLCVCHDTHLTHEFADATIFLAGGHEK